MLLADIEGASLSFKLYVEMQIEAVKKSMSENNSALIE